MTARILVTVTLTFAAIPIALLALAWWLTVTGVIVW